MASRSFIGRHPILTVFLLLLLGVVGYGVVLFASNKGAPVKPDLQNMQMTVKTITADSIKMQVSMGIHNALPMSIQVDSMSYQLAIKGDKIAQGSQHTPTKVAAFSDGQFTMPMNADLATLGRMIKTIQQDSVEVDLDMTLYNDFPLVGAKKIPVHINKKIYIPRLPKFEVESIKIADLSLKEGKLLATLKVTNYNSFPFTIDQFNYHFRLSDNVDVKGTEKEDITFKKTGTDVITVPINLRMDQIGEAIFKTLFKSKETNYQMNGTMLINTDMEFAKNLNVAFNSQGTLKDLKEVVKQATDKSKEVKEAQKEARRAERKEERQEKREERKKEREEKQKAS